MGADFVGRDTDRVSQNVIVSHYCIQSWAGEGTVSGNVHVGGFDRTKPGLIAYM